MKYKKTIILVLAIFLLSIASVSASEIDNTIASEDADSMELSADNDITEDNLQNNENNDKLTLTDNDETLSTNDTDVLGVDSATYSNLAEEIGQSGNIKLSHKNYTYNDGATAIVISEANKVIDGDGAVIDMKGSTIRAFDVSASGVTIKNLTIKNVNYWGSGGAIYFSGQGTVTNCNFINNYGLYGSSVYFHTTGTVTNCNFSNNNVSSSGTVYFEENGIVTNCSFYNNSASIGGAVSMNSGSVTNCNFTDNTATDYGGAVYFYSNGEVTNCNFINHAATGTNSFGGAVYMHSGDVKNSNFVNNSAQTGGAINFVGNGTVSNCSFSSNSASSQGGAIRIGAKGTVTDCNFSNNSASSQAGAIMFEGEGIVTYCNFTDNSATYNSGAIRFAGEGSVTDCSFVNNSVSGDGGAVYFDGRGEVTDCSFTDNKAISNGGAVYFLTNSEVTNCNFSNNSASSTGGAIRFSTEGTLTYCNFADNTVTYYGGAVYFDIDGDVIYCNFTDNTARDYGGAIYFESDGAVTNCNFINNAATSQDSQGGAIFMDSGTVTTSNFAGNNASKGGAIIAMDWESAVVDSCIFKTDSDTTFNTRNLPPILNVDNLTTIYGSGDKLIFDLKTNEGIRLTDGNISISVYIKDNNSWVGNYSCLSGEEWAPDLRVGSYYAIFDTEYAEFQPVNRTITVIIPPGKYYVNVTSLTTNNKTVNITAKTNIPENITWDGKLLFILPNMDSVAANYDGNGTWWAVHTFDDYTDYQVNATYVGLDNVTVTNATISISKIPTEITVENSTVELFVGDSVGTGATLTPADAGNLTFTSSNNTIVKVENGKIIAVGEGSAIITVSFAGNEGYVAAENKTISATVNLKDASVSVNNQTLDLFVGDTFTIVPTTIPGGLNVTFVSDNSGVYSIENGVITALKEGTGSVTVKVGGDGTYIENSTVVSVTVSRIPTEINVLNNTLVLEALDEVDAGVTLTPADAGNVTYTVTNTSVVKVENGKIIALKAGSTFITVSFAGDNKYTAAENKTISVTVKLKDASVSVNNSTLDLFVGDTFTISATTIPDGLNVTFVSDDSGVYSIENGVVTALKEGTGSVTVKVGGDGIYVENSTVVSVTVAKVPTEITVLRDTIVLEVLEEVDAGVTLTPADAGNVTYTVSNSSIVKVENGKIIALREGSTFITVSFAGDDKYAAAESKLISVAVNLKDASISVNNQTLELFVGDTFTISATTIPDGLTVTFIPDDSGVYSIDDNGLVTALKEGSGSVTVKVGGDGVYTLNTTEVSVSVNKVPTEINVLNDALVLEALDEVATGATLTPADAGNVTYTISNTSVVKVENEKIIALKEGSAIITVSFAGDDKYATAENKTISVTVNLKDANVSVNNQTLDLFVGDTFTISATTNPDGLTVTFVSDNSGVYSINENGILTALKNGTGSVTVKVGGDGVYVENSTVVKVVVNMKDASVSVNNSTLDLLVGNTFTIVPTTTPDGLTVTFVSDNSGVYSINENGILTALKNGTGSVTVKVGGDGVYTLNTTEVSVSVNKVPTEINVLNDTLVLEALDEIATVAALTPADAGNVTYTVSNSSVVKVENGKIIAISQGTANITISFAGDDKYAAAENKTISVTVNLKDANVSVNNSTLDLLVGETFTIVPTTTPDGLEVTFVPDDSGVYSINDEGVVTALKNGTGSIIVKVGDDSVYTVKITFVSVSVSKVPTEITVENATVELFAGNSVDAGATLTPAGAGNLTYTVSNTSVVKVENGKIIALSEGSAIITVSYAGDDKYDAAENKTISVTVNPKYESKVIISPIVDVVYPNNISITYSVENRTNVTVSIDGVSDDKIIITNDTVTVIGLNAGEYTITVINSENTTHSKSSDTKTFTVNKQATSIAATAVTATYNKNKVMTITLKDSNGKALANAKVTVVLKGTKTYTTDKNGQIKISTKGLAPKKYTAKITFNGNTNYAKSTKNVKVTVKKATPKITAKKKTFKKSVKVKKYKIVLKNNVGKAIKKAKVTIKIGKKTYKAKTNSKGKATFKIKKLTKKGKYKAKITYKGNAYYNKVTKKVKIKIK